jgi:hypothetical protein
MMQHHADLCREEGAERCTEQSVMLDAPSLFRPRLGSRQQLLCQLLFE